MKALPIVFLLFGVSCFAQTNPPVIQWLSGVETLTTDSTNLGIEVLAFSNKGLQGGGVVAFRCTAPCKFPSGQIIVPEPEGSSIVLAFYQTNGTLFWVKNLGYLGPLTNGILLSQGYYQGIFGIYLSGVLSIPQIDFGNSMIVQKACTGSCTEAFLVNFDYNGEAQWAKSISGGTDAHIKLVGIGFDGYKLYVAGNYSGTSVNFEPGFAYSNLPVQQFFLAGYLAETGELYLVDFPGAADGGPITLTSMSNVKNGRILLTADFSGSFKFKNETIVTAPPLSVQSSLAAKFLMTLDKAKLELANSIGVSNGTCKVVGTDLSQNGSNAYLALQLEDDLFLGDTKILSFNSNYAGVVLQLNAIYHSIPLEIYYNAGSNPVKNIKVDNANNLYTIGEISTPVIVGGQTINSDGCTDILVVATDDSGGLKWAKALGGTDCETIGNNNSVPVMSLDYYSNLNIAGTMQHSFQEGNQTLPYSGAFIARLLSGVVDTKTLPNEPDLELNPNPSTGSFSLTLKEVPTDNTQFILFDLSGREVFRETIQNQQTEISTRVPCGAYLALIQQGSQTARSKLIIQR